MRRAKSCLGHIHEVIANLHGVPANGKGAEPLSPRLCCCSRPCAPAMCHAPLLRASLICMRTTQAGPSVDVCCDSVLNAIG